MNAMADQISREVAALIQQREQYRAFLVRLEERGGEANPRAYERVKKDYETKLRALSEKLVGHVETVRQALEDAEASVTDLEVRRDAKAEELEEARLRHSVGEFAEEKEWKAVERKLAKELQELEGAVDKGGRAVANLSEILEQIEAESKAGAKTEGTAKAKGKAAAPPPGAAEAPGKPGRRVRAPGQIVSDTPPEPASDEPELADLSALDLAAAPPGPGASKGKGKGGQADDELEFLESLSLAPGEPEEREEGASDRAASPLSFLSKKASGRTETIICPRCSAANDPAEWYCVECGEELPAG